jgi:hypothetical protein
VQVQEYEKRLAIAVRLLGEEAGQRYMAQRLKDLRSDFEHRLVQEVQARLSDLTCHQPLTLTITIGPQGVQVRTARRPHPPRGSRP